MEYQYRHEPRLKQERYKVVPQAFFVVLPLGPIVNQG